MSAHRNPCKGASQIIAARAQAFATAKPRMRFTCSVCEVEGGEWSAGVMTRAQVVSLLQGRGWELHPGEAICPSCSTTTALRASLDVA